ncbi:TraM recognition domain-containing protein, partial [Bosea sp. TAB14]|uniref:TraM recognition domain-containing protein n=1 Tax=Bosea sp. TAB14 TaxID=3237481 RepID=UPI003F8FE007
AHLIDAIGAFVLSPERRSSGAGSYAMVLDEFPELGIAAEHLPRLLALGREAGVTTIATLQDLGQLEELYGQTKARLIEARLGIRCVLALEDGETAHRVSENWIGKRELRRDREATSEELRAGIKDAHEIVNEPVIAPSAIADDLGTFEKGGRLWLRAIVLGFATVAHVEVPLTIWPRRRPAFEPAPWLTDSWAE